MENVELRLENETGSGSVLVVDEDVLRVKTLREVLRPEFTFYATRNRREAVKVAEEVLPYVILLDIPEEEFNGYSVFAELKGSEKTRDLTSALKSQKPTKITKSV